jgi:hypothetical protein
MGLVLSCSPRKLYELDEGLDLPRHKGPFRRSRVRYDVHEVIDGLVESISMGALEIPWEIEELIAISDFVLRCQRGDHEVLPVANPEQPTLQECAYLLCCSTSTVEEHASSLGCTIYYGEGGRGAATVRWDELRPALNMHGLYRLPQPWTDPDAPWIRRRE